MAKLLIVEVLNDGYKANRFRLIEKVNTIDGPRDRITYATFATRGEAEKFVKARVDHYAVKVNNG